MKKQRRRCGGGCGQPLRSGSSRRAYVTTIAGGVSHATVCHRCAARGVLFVVFLDEPSLQQGPSRPRSARAARLAAARRTSNWFDDPPLPVRPSVGTMERADLEAELMRGCMPEDAEESVQMLVSGLSREALEARVVVMRAQSASSSGSTRAPKVTP